MHTPWLLIIRVSLASTFVLMLLYYTKLQVNWKWCLAISTPPIPAQVRSRPMRLMVSLSKTPLFFIVMFPLRFVLGITMLNIKLYGLYPFKCYL
jgi:hypothetical protein